MVSMWRRREAGSRTPRARRYPRAYADCDTVEKLQDGFRLPLQQKSPLLQTPPTNFVCKQIKHPKRLKSNIAVRKIGQKRITAAVVGLSHQHFATDSVMPYDRCKCISFLAGGLQAAHISTSRFLKQPRHACWRQLKTLQPNRILRHI